MKHNFDEQNYNKVIVGSMVAIFPQSLNFYTIVIISTADIDTSRVYRI